MALSFVFASDKTYISIDALIQYPPISSSQQPANMTDTSNIPANFPLHTTQLLSTLHAESLAQERGINSDHLKSIKALYPSDHNAGIAQMDELMLDKFIALDQDKCLFVYNTLLAMGAKAVVEAGTSFGVSTIYLALAVAASEKRGLGVCKVIATEKEASKAAKARGIWRECGADVGKVIDLREGDLEETLQGEYGLAEGQAVDGLLLDSKSFPRL